ncbi:glycosyltransferase family A protein [Paracoccus cavernae]|uniref:Glycosyltransferase family A protein n=1 Tax=Paracoccus cavernae TaxID=1571207 RepID=A0ABT8DA28_9RHOB|nr:glycosyltransferase family A protein [Paracoccus cavernae]
MTYEEIAAFRTLIEQVERKGPHAAQLYAYETEYLAAPEGISVIVPVHNGADEMVELMISLANQSLERSRFEVIFALNGCSDASRAVVDRFAATSGVDTVIIESENPSVAQARNEALHLARFRQATFVDHDDHLSRAYLEECVSLSDYRSVIVSNIIKLENGALAEDYAQTVVARGFDPPISTAPTILRCVSASIR